MPDFPNEFPFVSLTELIKIIKDGELVERRTDAIKLACWILGSAVEVYSPSNFVGWVDGLSPADAVVAEYQQASQIQGAGFSISPALLAAIKALLCSL